MKLSSARRGYFFRQKEKVPDMIKEFAFRFSRPKRFQSPISYLRVAVMPLKKKQVHLWKTFPQLISLQQSANFPLKLAKKSLTTVPF
ncbi:hypothetical protein MYX07_01070 [Patescibacteria group bacterium AH-259-L07]|nr:hypothetical protein [Patescibacteria group bacterium AH-259-L07]